MSGTDITLKKNGLLKQWSVCLIMVVVAWLMCLVSHTSFVGLFAAPISLAFQGCVAVGLSVATAVNGWVGYKMAARSTIGQHMFESYNRLDLRGWNPVQIAVAAGIGEEILFRGALQTLAGISVSSALFVLAHAKAYRFNTVDRRVVMQAIGILAISLVLAVVARYAGLLSAMVLHTAIDIGGLLSVRHFASRQTLHNSAEIGQERTAPVFKPYPQHLQLIYYGPNQLRSSFRSRWPSTYGRLFCILVACHTSSFLGIHRIRRNRVIYLDGYVRYMGAFRYWIYWKPIYCSKNHA